MSVSKQIHDAKLIKWTTLFKEQSDSGLNVKDWCSENGISKDTYYYWKRKVKEAVIDSSSPEIIPISVALAPASTTEPVISHGLSNSSPKSDSCGLYNLYNTPNSSDFIHISSKGICMDISQNVPIESIAKIIEVICHA